MRITRNILWVLAGFYIVMTVMYTVWSILNDGQPEWVGVVAFGLMFMFSAFIAFYLGVENKPFAGKKMLPEDRLDAEIRDADMDLGFFAPHSTWPIVLAGVAGAAIIGVCFGWWPVFFFAPLVLVALGGWTYEYYLGYRRH